MREAAIDRPASGAPVHYGEQFNALTHIVGAVLALAGAVVLVVALVPLRQALAPVGFAWLVAGGLFYTGGIVFYALDTRRPHAHGVWHLFVLAGSACHYYAILRCVV